MRCVVTPASDRFTAKRSKFAFQVEKSVIPYSICSVAMTHSWACRVNYANATTWHGYKLVSQELNDTGCKKMPRSPGRGRRPGHKGARYPGDRWPLRLCN